MIRLDVQRSEDQLPGVDSNTLLSVLRAYAVYNPEIEYCQGMNYLAGLLLLIFSDAEVAFKALVTIVQRFGIAEMFNQELPKLKMFFYQIDHLLGLVDEELHSHLKEEGVSSTLFASAWFITDFSSLLRENAVDGVVNESLLQIWDQFLCKGWKAIVKVSTYTLTAHRHEIKDLPFEDILPEISEYVKELLQQERIGLLFDDVKREFKGLHFSFHLKKLAQEFEESHREVNLQPLKNKQLQLD